LAIVSPLLRVALETLRLCVVGLTALVLALPHDQHGSVVRSAFVAALTVIAASSALLGVLPNVASDMAGAITRDVDPFTRGSRPATSPGRCSSVRACCGRARGCGCT
jgi:hypothetical protein